METRLAQLRSLRGEPRFVGDSSLSSLDRPDPMVGLTPPSPEIAAGKGARHYIPFSAGPPRLPRCVLRNAGGHADPGLSRTVFPLRAGRGPYAKPIAQLTLRSENGVRLRVFKRDGKPATRAAANPPIARHLCLHQRCPPAHVLPTKAELGKDGGFSPGEARHPWQGFGGGLRHRHDLEAFQRPGDSKIKALGREEAPVHLCAGYHDLAKCPGRSPGRAVYASRQKPSSLPDR